MIPYRSLTSSLVVVSILALPAAVAAAPPKPKTAATPSHVTTPRQFLGFTPGDDHKLANYTQSYAYFHKIAGQTKRIRLFEVGKSAMGAPMILTVISSEANLQKLDRWKQIARTLADGRVSETEARKLAGEGRIMVWLDGGMHATEVGSAQHTINLGFDLVTREDDEFRRIRDRAIVLLVPSINPDGQNLVANWFNKNYGTPQEGTPLPVLYQKYAGHDNNRDWYMQNLPETRQMTRLLYSEWFPQIVYNHHQAPGMYPERMFVPPYDEPMNPNIPPLILREVNAVGTAMHTRFEEENKTGIISLDTYTAWWNGGMRSTPFYHNVVGILTEVSHASPYAATYTVPPAKQEATMWYPNPYKGGVWHFADTVAYMNTGSLSLLRWAADNAEEVQMNRWRMAHTAIQRGKTEAPYGFIVPMDAAHQRDPNTTALFLDRLRLGGIEVQFADKVFSQDGKDYPAGTAVLSAAQPNRPFLMDMLLPQNHPTRRQGPNGPPIPPYDIAGWTLSYQMGVTTVPLTTALTPAVALRPPVTTTIAAPVPPVIPQALTGGAYLLPTERNASFVAANRLLAAGVPVERWTKEQTINGVAWAPGTFVIPTTAANAPTVYKAITAVSKDLLLPVTAVGSDALAGADAVRLRSAQVATYDPYGGSIPQGWAQFVLESFEFGSNTVTNPDLWTGKLHDRFDALLLTAFPNLKDRAAAPRRRRPVASTPTDTPKGFTGTTDSGDSSGDDTSTLGPGFLGGPAPKSLAPEVEARLAGIGTEGEANLKQFVEDGGTLLATDAAIAQTVELFQLPTRDVTKGSKFYSPGSVFRVLVDPKNPLCWGLPSEVNVFFDKGAAWDTTVSSGDGAFAVYPDANPLQSGWIIENQIIRSRAAAIVYRVGKGRVIVYGFDVTFRGQPHQNFPLLFNALYPTEPVSASMAP